MAGTRRPREIPYQDFTRIKNAAFTRRAARGYLNGEDLFTDPSFPPDWSSLTYVYSGDDKYEHTIFKRPTDLSDQASFLGVGGVIDEPFPWRQWKQRGWFQAAVVIISMNIRFLDRLIPGYKLFEQNFDTDYIGAFRFNLWRFTEWVEVVIDDHLPMLGDHHFFCKPIGSPLEYWAPLAEKAYAKCKKTFQAVEYGQMLDALTDLTGCVCEFYTPDVNPTDNLFHILYKSSINRSFMVCWRNEKRLTPVAFDLDDNQKIYCECDDQTAEDVRYLHVVTAATKFPTTDGRTTEMVRLRCPFVKEPKWHGKFSDRDINSWNNVNAEFKDRLRPLSRKEEDEYWVTMDDFRCNFGGLIILSSTEPYSCDGLSVERRYFLDNDLPLSKASLDRNRFLGSQIRLDCNVGQCSPAEERAHRLDCGSCSVARKAKTQSLIENGKAPIRTMVIDAVQELSRANDTRYVTENNSKYMCNTKERKTSLPPDLRDRGEVSTNPGSRRKSNSAAIKPPLPMTGDSEKKRHKCVGSGACYSDAFSSSDISLHLRANLSSDDTSRPQSAPLPRNLSSGSLSSLTQINFLATKADFFKSHGRWKNILEYKDKWTKNRKGCPRSNIEAHSKSPRILFHISRMEVPDEIISPDMQSKRHVIISTLQDYRHGASTANSLLVPIGFCIYKTKNPDRDEKRHVTKLHFIAEAEGKPEVREISARFDLEPGSYFIVPYFVAQSHEGEYLVRIFTEGGQPTGKGACTIS